MALNGAVVFCAGILGNQLQLAAGQGSSSGQTVWQDIGFLARGGVSYLTLGPDGLNPPVGQPMLLPGSPLPGSYGWFLRQLQGMNYASYWCPLDWRQPMNKDVTRLAQMVNSMQNWWPLNLIGHSRGGLVIRSFLNTLNAAQRAAMVRSVISLGTPHWGSWEPVGIPALWKWLLNALNLAFAWGIRYLSDWLVQASNTFAIPLTSWPSTFELLPAPNAPLLTDPSQWLQAYQPGYWGATPSPVNPQWLTNGLSNWTIVGPPPAGTPWLSICGYGAQTKLLPVILGDIIQQSNWQMTDGDGTVPLLWQRYGPESFLVTPTDHSMYTKDVRLLPYVQAWLDNWPLVPASQVVIGSYLPSDSRF